MLLAGYVREAFRRDARHLSLENCIIRGNLGLPPLGSDRYYRFNPRANAGGNPSRPQAGVPLLRAARSSTASRLSDNLMQRRRATRQAP